IHIQMTHTTGAVYALRSLASLLFTDTLEVPQLSIEDSPRYPFRGMHLDVSRNFRDKDYVIHLLEQMARYKLNRLHLHLGDDEGWRLAINRLPELTDIGSRRCHDPAETQCLMAQLGSGPELDNLANGYYTQADFIDILHAAQARQIEVIPSFDMPGHSRAAVVSMEARYQRLIAEEKTAEANEYRLIDPQDTTRYESVQFYNDNTINVCLDSSYRFIDTVLNDIQNLYQKAEVPLTRYHIGADETAGAWVESPACQALLNDPSLNLNTSHDLTGYFIEKVSNMVASKGIVPAGWNDGMSATSVEKMPSTVQSNAWTPLFWDGHKSAHEQANRQWQVVISTPDVTYFDFPYTADPLERGYYWGSRATNTEQVFDFMPNNLPAHAEQWPDRQGNPMTLNDTESHLKPGTQFYGVQGHLWTEVTRTDQQADYMIFPRLTALAERAWHQADWELTYNANGEIYSPDSNHFSDAAKQQRDSEWNHFANALTQKELPKLDLYDVAYRVPTIGADVIDNQLQLKSPLPGLPLQFKTDNREWQTYTQPVPVSGSIQIRALTSDGKRPGRTLTVDP
uniref:family 20 glycosylhydrolase n=1 Tax=Pseudomaricurvus sp. TaxID=2004510 RepID=UPI003F6B4C7D